jgi:hypothetical protein
MVVRFWWGLSNSGLLKPVKGISREYLRYLNAMLDGMVSKGGGGGEFYLMRPMPWGCFLLGAFDRLRAMSWGKSL